MYTPISLQLLLPVLLFITSAAAQDTSSSSGTDTGSAAIPTSTAGLDTCITTCTQQAATDNGCVSFTNVTCVCTSQAFQAEALSCLQANCTAADLQAATQLQQSICGAAVPSGASGSASSSGSGSIGPTATGPGPISASSTGVTGSSGSAPTVSQISTTGSGTTGGAAASSTGAAVGMSYKGLFGKGLGALVIAAMGAVVGGALVL